MKYFNLFTFAFLITVNTVSAQTSDKKEISITEGKEVSDSLSSSASHSYTISLDSAQFVFGKVNQKTVDVVVKVFNPENKQIAIFDGPAKGPEKFIFETKSSGKYRLEVSPFEEKQGSYSILISTVEPLASKPAGKVNQYMTPYKGNDVPGAAVIVAKDDKILFQEAYGMANLAYDIPFTVNTPTNIGSTSKQFTAFAIQLLAERGKLSLDDNIRKYFPELPEFDHPVTIRHLLTHTSGYREFLNTLAMTGRSLSSDLDRDMVMKIVKHQPELQNEPGTEWNYNNTGFALMARLVEKVTEVPFPEWMQTNVFKPLGMNNTQVRADQNQVIKGRSQGYNLNEEGMYQEATDLGGAMGAGGIYSTVGDLVKWVENFEDPKVGNQRIIKEMTTPFVLKDGDTTNYGLGIFVEEYKGLKQIHHGGADVAHRSMLMYFPEIDAVVITQSNFAGFAGESASKIADAFFSEHMEKKEEKKSSEEGDTAEYDYEVEKFDALTGRYELEEAPGFILTFKRDGDRIYAQATRQPEVNLTPQSDSLFSLQGVNAKITFHLKEDGSADSLTLHQNGDHLAKKISWDPTIEELKEFTGKYYSPEIETVYTVDLKEKNLVVTTYQVSEELELTPADKDTFSGGFPVAELSFERDEQGNIAGFKASNGRTRGVYFEKRDQLD